MEAKTSFEIYDASAGSGKTFTLVKAYLTILFKAKSHYQFKNILAITFTNKAVFEMKERIIKMLKVFADESVLTQGNDMFNMLCEDLQIEPEALHSKSKMLLHTIIHNYAAFEISTIDGFTHRIIRTFAHDLKLPINFEVELDTESLLNKAVDRLISKAGTDKDITAVLVQFALEKADDDKSWNIALDLNKIAKLLVSENDMVSLQRLKDKTLTDFNGLKKQLKSETESLEVEIVNKAKDLLQTFQNNDLTAKDFSRGTLFNHFVKVSKFEIAGLYNNQLEANIKDNKVYTAKLEASKAELIDGLLPEIEATFLTIKASVYNYKFRKNIYKNLTQLSVLNAINQELIALKDEENKMLISEFNALISDEIKAQPTPFIYERLGEKFNHYFIDEFQDTSKMQWENLIPLVSEAVDAQDIEKQPGSLMIVGDAKQAIYRWRGGEAEQFIDLSESDSGKNPFTTQKSIQTLDTNYRSFKEVIQFNNNFFDFVSGMAFSHEAYGNLYSRAHQHTKNPNEGYVSLSFLDLKDEDADLLYAQEIYTTIENCLANGYLLKDICVLVRKKKNAVTAANYLSEKGVPIISSEVLLIKQAPEVIFVTQLATLLFQPLNDEIKAEVLYFLADRFSVADKHAYMANHVRLDNDALFASFKMFGIHSDAKNLMELPLFDMFETIVREFDLINFSDAYLQYYLDIVLEYTQTKGSDIFGFLAYFESKIDNLSIVSPEGQDAVQIMTIHKSKGLEFPVVIFPFADLNIYEDIEPKAWFNLDAPAFNGFPCSLLNYNKSDFENFGVQGEAISSQHQSELELDSLNLLYVALTRPVEQLHIISSLAFKAKKQIDTKKYSGLFMAFLMKQQLWQDDTFQYHFGNPKRIVKAELEQEDEHEAQETLEFISTAKKDHNIKIVASSGYLWDTKQQDAIEKGNLVHNLMANIKESSDVEQVLRDAEQAGLISVEQRDALKERMYQIIEHPKLQDYFTASNTIYAERDIIKKDGTILRPDRLVILPDNKVTIIDYKTGLASEQHKQQLYMYQECMQEMGFSVHEKILVYIIKISKL